MWKRGEGEGGEEVEWKQLLRQEHGSETSRRLGNMTDQPTDRPTDGQTGQGSFTSYIGIKKMRGKVGQIEKEGRKSTQLLVFTLYTQEPFTSLQEIEIECLLTKVIQEKVLTVSAFDGVWQGQQSSCCILCGAGLWSKKIIK